MGSMTFVKKDTGARNSFDSSPQYSLPKMYGYAPDSVELVEINRTDLTITYNVHAKSTASSERSELVGTLFQKTRQAIWAELGRR